MEKINNKIKIGKTWILRYKKANTTALNYCVWQNRSLKNSCMFDLENVSKHFKLYSLYHNFAVDEPTVVHYFDDIVSNNTKMCFQLMFWSHEEFCEFSFSRPQELYLEFFQGHSNYNLRVVFDFRCFFNNQKTGAIDFSETLVILPWHWIQKVSFQDFIDIDRSGPRSFINDGDTWTDEKLRDKFARLTNCAKIFKKKILHFNGCQFIVLSLTVFRFAPRGNAIHSD